MYYFDIFKSDKKIIFVINEFRKRGFVEIRIVKKFVIFVRLICLLVVIDIREIVYYNNRIRF